MKATKRDYEFSTVVTSKAGLRRLLKDSPHMIEDSLAILDRFSALVVTFTPPNPPRKKVGGIHVKGAHRA
jgi:hypothetical protein